MTSSYTGSNRLLKQGAGDNTNTWGDLQSAQDFDRIDDALDGWVSIAVAGNVTLTTANGTTDQARMRNLMFTGAGGFTVTLPAVSKFYNVWNTCAAACSITNGSASVTVQPGECVGVINDGGANIARVQPTDFGGKRITSVGTPTSSTDAATKGYVDATAFTMAGGGLPGQGGNGGKFLTTDGSNASWAVAATAATGLASLTGGTIAVTASVASDVRTGTSTGTATTPGSLVGSAAFITLTDAATVAWDASTGYNASVTLGGNRTIGAPTNLKDGITYTLEVVQDGTGSRTVTWNAIWDWGAAGTPALQTAAGKADKVYAQYNARTSKLEASFRQGA